MLLAALIATALMNTVLLSVPAQAAQPSVLNHVGNATKVLIVASKTWTSTTATATQWQKRGGTWVAVRSGMFARVGRNGFKTDRREGDGTTPAGRFPLRYAFGGQPSPGTALHYQRIVPPSCWSGERSDYNRWVRRVCTARDEDLYRLRTSVYRYAAVVGFNDSPAVWGKGSAIFVHQTVGKATSGCIALMGNDIVATLRWLAPGALIVMGPESYVASL